MRGQDMCKYNVNDREIVINSGLRLERHSSNLLSKIYLCYVDFFRVMSSKEIK